MFATIFRRDSFSRRAICATGVALLTVVGAIRGQEGSSEIIARVQKSWRSRQEKVRSARFSWKEERTWPKGSISSQFGPVLPEMKGRIFPPADQVVDFSYLLKLDMDKVRFEYEGKEWATQKQTFRPVSYLSVFGGKTPKDLYPQGVGDADWPLGVIRRGNTYADAGLAALRPLLIMYRPFAPSLQPWDIQGAVFQGKSTVEGDECLELMERLPQESSVHFWLDPIRDFVLVRRLIVQQGKPFEQIDVKYKPDPQTGWIPASWKVVGHAHTGRLLCSVSAVLESAEFNVAISPTSFDLTFPPGARVQDERTMEHYILRKDGTKRPILSADIGATYEQMLNSPPGRANVPTASFGSRWAMPMFFGLSALLLGLLIWRRRRAGKLAVR